MRALDDPEYQLLKRAVEALERLAVVLGDVLTRTAVVSIAKPEDKTDVDGQSYQATDNAH